jgi:peptidoglycan/LPS O-acetylase OafA/YrhL
LRLPGTDAAQASDVTLITGYRPDIDGLRAVAIVLVVLSHMGIKWVAGGFVGVDIFFVISGYLLTGNIAHNIMTGNFSVASFYERRIRRIVPALVAMLAVTSLLAYFVLPSKALILYAESVLSATFSYSNVYFLFQPDGYFALTFTKFLLHTWSLGVEEQFYLVLPVCMLWAAKRRRDSTRMLVLTVGLGSFVCASYLSFTDRSLAFYMPYTRAWELLLGCTALYSASTPFPGLAALPPCAAAATLILIGERGRTAASAFLSWAPAVFIGAISYSLYLWHWPVIMFLRLGIVPDYGSIHALAALKILISVVIATISWRFVEQPFRTGRWKSMPRSRVFQIAAACAATLALVAILCVAGKGLPGRFPGNADVVGNYLFHDSTRKSPSCFVEEDFATFNSRLCLASNSTKSNVLLFGDSHANSLWLGLAESLPRTNVMQATASSCPPVIGHFDQSACGALRRFIYQDYLPAHHVDTVILTEAWNSMADYKALEPALQWFRSHHTRAIVIGPAPDYTGALPLLLAIGDKWQLPLLAEHRLVSRMGILDGDLAEQLRRRNDARYASIWRALCPKNHCEEYADRGRLIPMLLDSSHLGDEGARLAAERMLAVGELPR